MKWSINPCLVHHWSLSPWIGIKSRLFCGNWKNQTGKTLLSVARHHSCCINLQWQGGPSSNKWSWDWLEGRRLLPTRCPPVDYKMLTCDAFVGKTPGDNVSIENHNWDNLLSISLSAKDFYWRGQVISQAQALRRHLFPSLACLGSEMFLCLILQSNEPWVCHLAFFLWTSGNYLNLINSDGDLKGILNKKSNIFKNQLVIKDFGINFTSRLKWDWCSCEMGWIRYCLIWMGPIQYSTYTEMEISR